LWLKNNGLDSDEKESHLKISEIPEIMAFITDIISRAADILLSHRDFELQKEIEFDGKKSYGNVFFLYKNTYLIPLSKMMEGIIKAVELGRDDEADNTGVGYFSKQGLSYSIKKEDKEEIEVKSESKSSFNAVPMLLEKKKAIADMTDVVTDMFDKIQIGVTKRNSSYVEKYAQEMADAEDYVDQMHEQITHFLIKCQGLQITEKQLNHISCMIQIVDELENMSDNCYTSIMLIIRSIEKKMEFKTEDMERLLPYIELVRQFLQFIRININKQITQEKLELAAELENGIDAFRKDLKKVARKRLEGGADVKAELLYIDMVRRIENIGDNCFSISESLTNG
jgi:hypothetical protein